MIEYTLVCPNALVVKKKGLTISTSFTYKSMEEALQHKELCDKWDKEQGKEPQSYITTGEVSLNEGRS